MSVKNITVDHNNEGRRIDNFLFSNFKNIPKSKIYKVKNIIYLSISYNPLKFYSHIFNNDNSKYYQYY